MRQPPSDDLVAAAERRHEVADILARALLRLHRRARTTAIIPAQESQISGDIRLELTGASRLSASTGGLTPPSDGDER